MLMRLTDSTVGGKGYEMRSLARIKYLPPIYLYNTISLLGKIHTFWGVIFSGSLSRGFLSQLGIQLHTGTSVMYDFTSVCVKQYDHHCVVLFVCRGMQRPAINPS
jgi:hypothetical protein